MINNKMNIKKLSETEAVMTEWKPTVSSLNPRTTHHNINILVKPEKYILWLLVFHSILL